MSKANKSGRSKARYCKITFRHKGLRRTIMVLYTKTGKLNSIVKEQNQKIWQPHQELFPSNCPVALVKQTFRKFKDDALALDPKARYQEGVGNPI